MIITPLTPLTPLSPRGISGMLTNICITSIGTDGTWLLFEEGNFGEANPDTNIIDQPLYSAKCKADGSFVVSFGAAGNDQVPDVPQIFIWHRSQSEAVNLVWNETTTQYEGMDLTLATYLFDQYNNHGMTKTCFWAKIEPVLFIHLIMGKMI